jgi:hypothetical protein
MTGDSGGPGRVGWRYDRRAWVVAAVALAAVVGLGVWWQTAGRAGRDRSEAVSQCQDAVRARLRAPATADFVSGAAAKVPGVDGADTYEVTGAVDSENGFGANVRTTFGCRVLKAPYGWTVASVSGLDG